MRLETKPIGKDGNSEGDRKKPLLAAKDAIENATSIGKGGIAVLSLGLAVTSVTCEKEPSTQDNECVPYNTDCTDRKLTRTLSLGVPLIISEATFTLEGFPEATEAEEVDGGFPSETATISLKNSCDEVIETISVSLEEDSVVEPDDENLADVRYNIHVVSMDREAGEVEVEITESCREGSADGDADADTEVADSDLEADVVVEADIDVDADTVEDTGILDSDVETVRDAVVVPDSDTANDSDVDGGSTIPTSTVTCENVREGTRSGMLLQGVETRVGGYGFEYLGLATEGSENGIDVQIRCRDGTPLFSDPVFVANDEMLTLDVPGNNMRITITNEDRTDRSAVCSIAVQQI